MSDKYDIRNLEGEIKQLKEKLNEQEQRIKELESFWKSF